MSLLDFIVLALIGALGYFLGKRGSADTPKPSLTKKNYSNVLAFNYSDQIS